MWTPSGENQAAGVSQNREAEVPWCGQALLPPTILPAEAVWHYVRDKKKVGPITLNVVTAI